MKYTGKSGLFIYLASLCVSIVFWRFRFWLISLSRMEKSESLRCFWRHCDWNVNMDLSATEKPHQSCRDSKGQWLTSQARFHINSSLLFFGTHFPYRISFLQKSHFIQRTSWRNKPLRSVNRKMIGILNLVSKNWTFRT